MPKPFSISRIIVQVAALAGVLLLTTAQGPAQANLPQRNASATDPFAAYHDALTSTADDLLASPAQRSSDTGTEKSPSVAAPTMAASRKTRQRSEAIKRVQQLRPVLESILREEQVPTELAAVVLIESGGQSSALSPKGARGIWQFMPETARRYGLVVSRARDDRTDVEKSTHAAARYLRDLYAQFGSWSLALAAYNAGELLVKDAVSRTGSNDFSAISSKGRLPVETQNYVPAVWSAMQRVEGHPSQLDRDGAVRSRVVYASGEIGN